MSLDVDIAVAKGDLRLEVALQCDDGETVAIVGPNGSGKTTLLRAISGLDLIERGSIQLDGRELRDEPPERRSVSLMFQDDALFPHLGVVDNVAFGLRRRGTSATLARAVAREWLGRVGLGDNLARSPTELSGGEAQRVALARALAPGPAALLLDEPLSALDAATRNDIRRLLRDHLAAFEGPRLIVTHDPVDASVLADRVVVLDRGRVAQTGTPTEISVRPRHPWVADLAATNLFAGQASGADVALDGGGSLRTGRSDLTGAVYAVVSPRSVIVHREQPTGSPRNAWPGRVTSIESVGAVLRVRVDGTPPITAEITGDAAAQLELAQGVAVWVAVKATEVDVYPA